MPRRRRPTPRRSRVRSARRHATGRQAPRQAAAREHFQLESSTFVPAQDWAVTCPRLEEPARGRVLLRSCLGGVCPIQVQGTTHGPALPGVGAEDERACWGQAPGQRCSAWPRAKLGAMSSTAGRNTTRCRAGCLPIRSLRVIHPQSALGSWRRHEPGASSLEPPPVRWSGPRAPAPGLQPACVVFPRRSGGLGDFDLRLACSVLRGPSVQP